MPQGKKANDRQRLAALAAYAATSSSTEASKTIGVAEQTVCRWVADSPEALERIRRDMQAEFMPEIVEIGRVLLLKLAGVKDLPMATARDAQSLAVVFGILVDKARLLLGLPDRVELYGSIEHSFSTLSERQREVAERERALREQFGPVLEAEFRVREASEAAGDGEHYVK